jgi:putative ABC transport system ATP-binding protein
MIEVKNLTFSYGDDQFRIEIPQLTINNGEKIVIVGPSGTGKTTLLNLLSGILTPSSGQIRIDDLDLTTFSFEDRQDFRMVKMGLVFQEFELLDYLNVLDNILLPYRVTPIHELTTSIRKRVEEIVSDVGLSDKLKRHPAKLSQGERQRVAVCRALLTEPAYLFGDEPTGNLDPKNRDHVMEILFDYSNNKKAPLLVVTHDSELIERFDKKIDVREFQS